MKYNNFKEKQLGNEFCEIELSNVKKLIDESCTFTVVGMPAMGVSIFMRFLATMSFADFVHVDINELPALSKNNLFRLMAKELGSKAKVSKEQEALLACKDSLTLLCKGKKKIVIVFNRFDKLKNEFGASLFNNLRSLRDIDKEKIVMIFSANKPLLNQIPGVLSDGNLNMYSKTLFIKPYSRKNLERLVEVNSPLMKQKSGYKSALMLSGGHYQLLQLLLKSDDLILNFATRDPSIKFQLKNLADSLNYVQKKQLQKVALGKDIKDFDQNLVNLGFIKKISGGKYKVFSPLFSEYLKNTSRLKLPSLELKLFKILRSNLGKVVDKDFIFESLWPDGGASDWALNALVYRLRKNPLFISSGFCIESHKKIGYCLVAN